MFNVFKLKRYIIKILTIKMYTSSYKFHKFHKITEPYPIFSNTVQNSINTRVYTGINSIPYSCRILSTGKRIYNVSAFYGIIIFPLLLSSVAFTKIFWNRSKRVNQFLHLLNMTFYAPTIICISGIFVGSLMKVTGLSLIKLF